MPYEWIQSIPQLPKKYPISASIDQSLCCTTNRCHTVISFPKVFSRVFQEQSCCSTAITPHNLSGDLQKWKIGGTLNWLPSLENVPCIDAFSRCLYYVKIPPDGGGGDGGDGGGGGNNGVFVVVVKPVEPRSWIQIGIIVSNPTLLCDSRSRNKLKMIHIMEKPILPTQLASLAIKREINRVSHIVVKACVDKLPAYIWSQRAAQRSSQSNLQLHYWWLPLKRWQATIATYEHYPCVCVTPCCSLSVPGRSIMYSVSSILY